MENLKPVERLAGIVQRLRAPGGCPWDREQTHESLRGLLVEECHEVVEAIESRDDTNLREELGDLLLHIVMHAQLASERGAFTLSDIAGTICEKMIRRHPHVFGGTQMDDSEAVLKQWDEIKRAEKPHRKSALDGIAGGLPALLKAQTVQKKAARAGFDWPHIEPVFDKIREETLEVREALAVGDKSALEAEIGDLLFSVVNLARKSGVDAETALGATVRRFTRRFEFVERSIEAAGKTMTGSTLEELDGLWEQAKKA